MEQIFRSLLQKQGYEYISLVNSDKGIWGYAKDGVYHFCKSDLSDVDRKEIGITEEIAVLSIRDGNVALTKDEDYFPSCIILDKANKILEILPPSTPPYIFNRLNSNSIVITKPIFLRGCGFDRLNYRGREALCPVLSEDSHIHEFDYRIIENLKDKGAFICLDGVLEPKLFPYMYYEGGCYFLSKGGMIVYHPQKGIIYNNKSDEREHSYIYDDNIYPPHVLIWSVKNRGVFFVESNSENEESANIVTITPLDGSRPIYLNVDDITKKMRDSQHDNSRYWTSIYGAMCSEDYLILPFCEEEGLFIIHISDEGFSAKCLYKDSHKTEYTFQNGIIKSIFSYEDGYYHDGEFYTSTRYEYEYYDAECFPLNVVAENNRYLIYWKNVSSHNRTTKRYGVLQKDDCQTILPPIYNAISFNDDYSFDVELKNEVNGKEQILKGLFSVENGFVLPIGIEYHHPEYWNNITGTYINTAETYYFNIFSFGEHEGLLFGDEKVLEPIYDSIEGFHFKEKFNEDERTWNYDPQETERKTKEYQPLSVILYKDEKRGLFIDKEHFIEPIFDRIKCCKVLKGYAYFEAQQGEKKRIISDDIVFYEKYQELYDNIVIEDYGRIVYFNVYKDGKIGMISTDTNYSIPIQYKELQVFSKCYIGDGFFYTGTGQKLFSEDDYELDAEQKFLVFKNVHSADYVFVTLSGEMLKSESINKDLITVKGNGDYVLAKYSTKDKCFIKEEENNWIPYDDYPTDDDIKMGLMEAYNGDPEALWNND
jgi:hypothetical protein